MNTLKDKFTELNTMFLHKGLPSEALTADQKKRLFDKLSALGMPMSTAYRRFFDKGFDEWELQGINRLKQMFLNESVPCLDSDMEAMDDIEREQYRQAHQGDRGYLAVLALAQENLDLDNDGGFYLFLKDHTNATAFRRWMLDKGMSSITCGRRFLADNWQPWERQGIIDILKEWLDEESEQPLTP